MTLSQLRYFVAICENETNMTKAATSLHISQSALSRSINDLEKELGVLLFLRSKQRIELTSSGKLLLSRARDILGQIDELPSIINQHGRSRLLIGIHPSPMYFILSLLNSFVTDYPDITILIDPPVKRRAQLTADVAEGKLDAAVIAYDQYDPDTQLFNVLPLKDSQAVYVVDKGHPLSQKKVVSYEEIARYPLYGYIFQAQRHLATAGIVPKLTMSTSDPRVMAKMLEDKESGAIMLRELAQTIPNASVIGLENNLVTHVAVISLKDPAPAKRRALNTFLKYIEDNKHKMRYLFDD